MALQLPVVASPIGANKEIIIDSKNGFLAENNTEWYKKIKLIINDKDLRKNINISSANSINVGRWLPQMIYYFILYKELKKNGVNNKTSISVPSGNFGNICAGFMAQKMGLNFDKIISSTNINDTIPRYLS